MPATNESKSGTKTAKPKTTKSTAKAKTTKKASAAKSTELAVTKSDEAAKFTEETKAKATELANDAKHRIGDAISNLGGLIGDSASVVDERLGAKYGDMARKASETVSNAGKKVDESDLGELAEETREFVRKSPALAIGIAAAAGFVVARLFKSGSNDN